MHNRKGEHCKNQQAAVFSCLHFPVHHWIEWRIDIVCLRKKYTVVEVYSQCCNIKDAVLKAKPIGGGASQSQNRCEWLRVWAAHCQMKKKKLCLTFVFLYDHFNEEVLLEQIYWKKLRYLIEYKHSHRFWRTGINYLKIELYSSNLWIRIPGGFTYLIFGASYRAYNNILN